MQTLHVSAAFSLAILSASADAIVRMQRQASAAAFLRACVRACSRAIHWTGRRVGTARCLAFYERQVDYTRVLVFISYVFVFFLLFILRVDESAEARRAVAVIGGV